MAVIRSHKWEKPVHKMLMGLGIYSGCRVSELCNLKKKRVVLDEGSNDLCPLIRLYQRQLPGHIKNKQDDDLVIAIDSKTAILTVSNFKVKYVTDNKRKGIHSFRHTYITAMECAGVIENVTAQTGGHERGKTMSMDTIRKVTSYKY